ARVERRRDDRERSTLTASRDREIDAVPFRMARQKVVGAHAAEIHAPVIVAVATFEAEVVVVEKGSRAERVVDGLLHRDRDAVNPYLQRDDPACGHVGKTRYGRTPAPGTARSAGYLPGAFGSQSTP